MKFFKWLKDIRIGFDEFIIFLFYFFVIGGGLAIFSLGALFGRFIWK